MPAWGTSALFYWSYNTGTIAVWGDLLNVHNQFGGVSGVLGYPITRDITVEPGLSSYVMYFQHGAAYAKYKGRNFAVYGTLWAEYAARGGHAGWRTVVIARRAQNHDAIPVDAPGLRQELQRLK